MAVVPGRLSCGFSKAIPEGGFTKVRTNTVVMYGRFQGNVTIGIMAHYGE